MAAPWWLMALTPKKISGTETHCVDSDRTDHTALQLCVQLAVALRQAGVAPSREKQTEAASRAGTPQHMGPDGDGDGDGPCLHPGRAAGWGTLRGPGWCLWEGARTSTSVGRRKGDDLAASSLHQAGAVGLCCRRGGLGPSTSWTDAWCPAHSPAAPFSCTVREHLTVSVSEFLETLEGPRLSRGRGEHIQVQNT